MLPRPAPVLILLAALLPSVPDRAAAADWRPGSGRPSAAQIEALRRWLCPNGGRVTRGAPGRCDGTRRARVPGGGPATGGGGGSGGDDGAEGWFLGLPPARAGQAACPDGMRAVPVAGHNNTVRCLPG